jgi:hypothetical protein
MNDLSKVVAGDLLAHSYGWNQKRILKVDRTTKTMVICGQQRFDMNGYAIGSGAFQRDRVWPATEADFVGIRIAVAEAKLEKFEVNKDNLEAVEALLKSQVKNSDTKEVAA